MIKHDYKPQNSKTIFKRPAPLTLPSWMTHPFLIVGVALAILALAFRLSAPEPAEDALATIESVEKMAQQEKFYSDPIAIQLELKSMPGADKISPRSLAGIKWQTESVKTGDNLSNIFKRLGLSPQLLHKVVSLDDNTKLLTRLKPGEVIAYQLDQEQQLAALKYSMNIQQTLFVEFEQGQPSSRIENKTIELRTAFTQGEISDSLFAAGKQADLSDTQVMQLANIFDWDIDFHLDIRQGDSFSVLYQEKYLEGEKIGNGEIVAAEFINQGKRFTAVRYVDSQGNASYFTPDGLSMRKAFLRAPLKFNYISSNFKPKRFHPILKRWKAHRGIDYRARTGTPIRAAGDGKVIASSYSKYNGKYVFLQHGQGIVTKYLHMSRRAVSKNKRVKQGQVIGYVGATGLAEAPHLHYEFLVNGVHRNPRTVKLPKAEPIARSEKTRFIAETTPWLNQLSSRNSLLALNYKVAP